MIRLCFLLMFYTSIDLNGQLKPFIGMDIEPKPGDSICIIPNYLGNFSTSGYQIGDTVNDFRLFQKDGQAFLLSERLATGIPVLLISSSYTCPVFRGKVEAINELVKTYNGKIQVYVVYTVEAHPEIDISPYFGRVNTGSPNINEGILYRQPRTYGERLQIVDDMLADINLDAPVIVDGPCNSWWLHYGPAPNNATFIDTDGIVRIKHAWFDRAPDDIFCDLEQYFNPGKNCDSIPAGTGNFSFTMVTDTMISGDLNSTMYAQGTIENNSTSNVTIEVRRLQNVLPANWLSSICLDVCYPTDVDSTQITLKPGQKMQLIIDVFSSDVAGTARLRMGMRNVNNTQNRAIMQISATASEITTSDKYNTGDEPEVVVYPKPATSYLKIRSSKYNQYKLFDQNAQVFKSGWIDGNETIDRSGLPAGVYFLKLTNEAKEVYYTKIVFL